MVASFVDEEGDSSSSSDDESGRPSSVFFLECDDAVMHQAVSDAGQFAFGIVMVEVWLLTKDQTRLYRPQFGWWVDPVFATRSDDSKQQALARLTDPTRLDYVTPKTLAMGEGLPGLLWVEAKNMQGREMAMALRSTLRRVRARGGTQVDVGGVGDDEAAAATASGGAASHRRSSSGTVVGALETVTANKRRPSSNRTLVFCNVNQISTDPEQPYCPRLRTMVVGLGIGWCLAVPMFDGHNHQGIVLYLARNGVNLAELQSTDNQSLLVAATRHIEATIDVREARRHASWARRTRVRDNLRRVRRGIVRMKLKGISLLDAEAAELPARGPSSSSSSVRSEPSRPSRSFTVSAKQQRPDETLKATVVRTLQKSRGGGGMIPPAMSTYQSCYSCGGAFVTLTILYFIDQKVKETYDTGLAFVPFGSFVTMLYSLTGAPVTQPRNALLGQIVSVTVAVLLSYLTSIPPWLRMNLAASLAAGLTSKLGIVHPPAGGVVVLFTLGSLKWDAMLVLLVLYTVAIGISMIVNNWSVERQYPIYWGIPCSVEGTGGSTTKTTAAQLRRRIKIGRGTLGNGATRTPKTTRIPSKR